jgi:cyclophilin family peptidyl-prolyl cis-trans isomerase
MMHRRSARYFSTIAAAMTMVGALLVPGVSADSHTNEKTETSKTTEKKNVADPIATIDAFIAEQNIDKTNAKWKTKLKKPPQASFDSSKTYIWLIETNEGPIRVQLLPDDAPMHASSTIYLSRLGFYDGLTFHRVIPGFMAQGGDPLGTGTGGPGYQYDGEFSPMAKHDTPGILSMANAGPGTDGSQFFLTFVPTGYLDGKHTVFGKVVGGDDTLKKLESFGSPGGSPSKKLEMTKTTIIVE